MKTLAPILLALIALLLSAPAYADASPCPPAEVSMRVLDDAQRYELHHGCITLTGLAVGQVLEVSDGELHTFVQIDDAWRSTFDPDGLSTGPLIIDTEAHTGPGNPPLVVPLRQRVAITGALVYDRLRGYGRINPVWSIEW